MTSPVILRQEVDELNNIYYNFRMAGITFTKAVAARIVGSRYRLERLVREKKIRMTKPGALQNSPWECNGEDVLRHAYQYL
jgi:hypothetical protein